MEIGEKKSQILSFEESEYKLEIERLEGGRHVYDDRLYMMNDNNKRGRKYKVSVELINDKVNKYKYDIICWDGELRKIYEEVVDKAEEHSESIAFDDDLVFIKTL